jgi:hypothetical protein
MIYSLNMMIHLGDVAIILLLNPLNYNTDSMAYNMNCLIWIEHV